ncbi:MAG TPA: carbohydrate ABC transporter permease [Chloroflexota bacterium]|nr:carbohydrate ABC transporter permease [Chloroflexota bacterium]
MRRNYHIGRWIVCIFICIWSLFPIYWALNTSLTTPVASQSAPAHFVPSPLVFDNYRRIFGLGNAYQGSQSLWTGFRASITNSFVEGIATTVLTVAIAALGAYAFARMRFFGRRLFFYTVLTTLALPAYATLIPLYRIMSDWGLVNTYTGVVLVYVSGYLPLAMWILYNYFLSIPISLEEAALVDGASEVRTLVSIVAPLAVPALAAVAIITFLTAWAEFLFPLVMTSDLSTEPLTVFITSIRLSHIVPYTLLNAVGVMGIVVPAIIVMFLNRYIVTGILAGSGK